MVGLLLSAAFPVRDRDRHPEMGNDVPGEQHLQGFEPLRCCGRVVVIAAVTSPGPAEGADVWFEPAQDQPTVLQTGGKDALTCTEASP